MTTDNNELTEEDKATADDLQAFWIASYPKSGNTWLRLALESYVYGKPADLNGFSPVPYIRKDYYDKVAGRELHHGDVRTFALLKQAALWHQLQDLKVRPLVMKTHDIAASLNGINLYSENLTQGSIYLVRDPRDIVLSAARHMGISIDEAIDGMNQHHMVLTDVGQAPNFCSSWLINTKSWTKNHDVKNCHTVRYEDMVDNFEPIFRKVINLILTDNELQETVDEERFRQAVQSTNINRLQAEEERAGFREATKHTKFFGDGGGYNKWKKILTPEQVLKIESANAEMMVEFGYELYEYDYLNEGDKLNGTG